MKVYLTTIPKVKKYHMLRSPGRKDIVEVRKQKTGARRGYRILLLLGCLRERQGKVENIELAGLNRTWPLEISQHLEISQPLALG
jgi:hypothetical protein